jgi:acyl transferase domain-containing protein/acyl-CoA synthetase (AMP-forming)/AMP-acid ligase II/acyl carrier protein
VTHPTFVHLLRSRASLRGQQPSYIFLSDRGAEENTLTYNELDRRARRIGANLQQLRAPGERALLLFPPGLDYVTAFYGCLYGGIVAIPAYPPRMNRPMLRLRSIVEDAGCDLVLTTAQVLSRLQSQVQNDDQLGKLQWVATDTFTDGSEDDWREPALGGETLAYLQYTSGSTGRPRGVMLNHANIMDNSRVIAESFGLSGRSFGVSWLPPYHDMGLIGGVLQPPYSDMPVVLMPPLAFLQKPLRWLEAISRYRATISGAPNFAYDLCIRKITAEQRQGLDLSRWETAFNGAEPVRAETLDRFSEIFGECGFRREAFYPCYGLAEATLMVSGAKLRPAPQIDAFDAAALEQHRVERAAPGKQTRVLAGCGRALQNHRIVIVDPEKLEECPGGRIGEVWFSGSSVAQGYWNRPAETEHAFRAYIAHTAEGPFLRTGDLGFMHDGELFVTGRLKDLIIVRGSNHYPQDIEWTVEKSHSALRAGAGAAVTIESEGEEKLVIVQEIERRPKWDLDEVAGAVRQAVSDEHGLEVHAIALIQAGSIPKTSSGKIRRHACKEGFISGTLELAGQWVQVTTGPAKGDEGAAPTSPSTSAIEEWLKQRLSERLKVSRESLDVRAPFSRYGLDSLAAVEITLELELWLGQKIPPTLAWEYPTIQALAAHLGASRTEGTLPRSESEARGGSLEPIAIIGIGCRFPGAADPSAFWQLLRDGVDAVREVPADRWNKDDYYDPDPAAPGKMNTRWGGFLNGIDMFDPQFFGIAPREAVRIDPQQRILLEVAFEALRDGGQSVDKLAGSRTGVFIGISTNDYLRRQFEDPHLSDAYAGTGGALSIAANRISYLFDFHGPSMAIDTACSSSLVAVHLACRSLWSGESVLALAGGANLILSPMVTVNFTKSGFMAPDGRCKAFDARANGYVRGEGAGIVVLKPLSQALAGNDSIYAVIRATAVNQDGRSNGLTAPNPQAQEAVLKQAYERCGISPALVQYVEAHGTGTLLGDPIEARALGNVLSEGRTEPYCAIGSVKTNIGHLEAAAGIAGLIKVALSLKHRELPPSLHFETPNPHIPFDDLRLRLQQNGGPWPQPALRLIAGVSSFGFGGTNAHAVLEEAPELASEVVDQASGTTNEANDEPVYVLPISAHTPEALQDLASSYRNFLAGEHAVPALDRICFTAAARQGHHDHRLALVGRSKTDCVHQLERYRQGKNLYPAALGHTVSGSRPKLAFVFSGQGGQWAGMGAELIEREPVFRAIIEKCDTLLRRDADWSLTGELRAGPEQSRLHETERAQPALVALQVALAGLWNHWGIVPDAVAGHSVGEIAAACVAGALSLEDAMHIAAIRGRLMQRRSGHGKMAAVELTLQEAAQAIASYGERLVIAAHNGPRSVVLSGEPESLNKVVAVLESDATLCRMLPGDFAFHSPQMAVAQNELVRELSALKPRRCSIPLFSTVDGRVSDGRDLDAGYWGRNLRERVQFANAIDRLIEDSCRLFLEIGPHPVLLPSITERLAQTAGDSQALPSMHRRDRERTVMLKSIAALYARGFSIAWDEIYRPRRRPVALPPYPWQRARYWIESKPAAAAQDGTHPFLGRHFTPALHAGEHYWETSLGIATLPYLDDHRLNGSAVFPAAAFIEMATAAALDAFGPAPCSLCDVAIQEALPLLEADSQTLQCNVGPVVSNVAPFRIFSRSNDWKQHVSGAIRVEAGRPEAGAALPEEFFPEAVKTRCARQIDGEDFYTTAAARGMHFGPSFRAIEKLWLGETESLGWIQLPPSLTAEAAAYGVHPVLLDASFQVAVASAIQNDTDLFIPVGCDGFRLHARPAARLWSHARVRPDGAIDVRVFNEDGNLLAECTGLRVRRAPAQDWFYTVNWVERSAAQMPVSSPPGRWLVFSNGDAPASALAQRLQERGDSYVLVTAGQTYSVVDAQHCTIAPDQPEHYRLLIWDAGAAPMSPTGVVFLWSADGGTDVELSLSRLESAQERSCRSVLYLVQALLAAGLASRPRLWLVTRGSLQHASLRGLSRVIASEHPELRCSIVDLDTDAAGNVGKLCAEICGGDNEDQVAFKNGIRHVARLQRVHVAATTADRVFRLHIAARGILENLTLQDQGRRAPGAGEVEIEVEAAGLNFRDVLNALGSYPGPAGPLGLECSGRIAALGQGVTQLAIGDEVVAIASGAFASFATTAADAVVRKPDGMAFDEAATIPVAFLTAHYGLHRLAGITAGDRVLIHAAAGGVGLAAVQIALRAGAQIFATAGSAEKREFLASLGVTHIMNSRTLDFADQVMQLTGGRGVDVVLNSLAGEFIPKSLSILGERGRFVEIGKTDLWNENRVAEFKPGVKYYAFDLLQVAQQDPALIHSMLQMVMHDIAAGHLQPLARRVFPIEQAAGAFRYMAQAKHTGKVVLALKGAAPLRPDATYLVTGGLGALGLKVADWMVRKGARHLVLIGRHRPSAAAAEVILGLESSGANVFVCQADAAQQEQVASVLAQIDQTMPPLGGIVHAAGVLDDGALLQQNWDRFENVMAPKVRGAWILHTLTQDRPLDFFVMFSSAAALLGSPGQANYAAANAFLDALAQYRTARGLPALSINWGPWADGGMAASPRPAGNPAWSAAMQSLSPAQGLGALERLLRQSLPQVAVLPVQWEMLARLIAAGQERPLLTDIFSKLPARRKQHAQPQFVEATLATLLANASPQDRREIILTHIREQLVATLGLDRATPIEPKRKLADLGMDSLMAVELRNRLQLSVGRPLPATVGFEYPTLESLSDFIASRVLGESSGGGQLKKAGDAAIRAETDSAILADIQKLSEAEVLASLANELSSIKEK